jgi:putative PIN family toxin of toxin-antitoxin system
VDSPPSVKAAERHPLRVVFDTNVLVSVLLYRDSALAYLPEAWAGRAVVPLSDQSVIDELSRILIELGARKFQLHPAQVQEIVTRYVSVAEPVPAIPATQGTLPKCKDPDDQKFLELAQRGKADMLVTNDGALLGLARRTPFLILSASKFRAHTQALLGT